ncbi:MAG: hypothetical protein ACFFAN_15890 [Promethearchaeota archaeon]
MSDLDPTKKPSRWTKFKHTLKKGAKKLIPVAVGWAAGVFFPPAGAALYTFLKEKLDDSPIAIPFGDEMLKKLCEETIGEKSIEFLQKKLRKILSESAEITKEQIEMLLDVVLRPLNESINEAMAYIKEFPNQISYLMEEWKAENAQLINKLNIDMVTGFEELNTVLTEKATQILDGITHIMRELTRFESMLDRDFSAGAKLVFSSDNIKNLDLRLVSKAQLSNVNHNIKSLFDIPFDPDLYVNRADADYAFEEFLIQLSSPYASKYYFLVLAAAGMGKTWTLASWVNKLSEESFDFPEANNFVPFFIPLKLDMETQLKALTGTANIRNAIRSLKNTRDVLDLTPIIFIDGLDEIRPNVAKSVLNAVLDLSDSKIPVVMSCRDADWSKEDKIIQMHSSMSEKCFEHKAGASYDVKEVSCQPSLYLETFNDKEFKKAIEKYKIPIEAFYNGQLHAMARQPILLRLFSEYYIKKGILPNPINPGEFKTIFLGERGDPIKSNILGRLGIFGKRKDYLVKLTSKFLEKGAELNANDLGDLIESENYKIVRSAGLIREEWGEILTIFSLNNLYKPHLEYMAKLAGVIIKKSDITKPIESSLKGENSTYRKKYDYFIYMGNDYLESKEYKKALDNYQQARETSKEFYDPKLTKKADNLIKQTENLIKKEEKAIEKAKRASEEKKGRKGEERVKRDSEEKKIKEEEEKKKREIEVKTRKQTKLQHIIQFRGSQIPQFEANILQELEKQLNRQFVLVDKIIFGRRLIFTAKSQRITGIGLCQSELSTLPESISNLTSLQILRLEANKLKALPQSIGNLKSLEYLNLRHNQLTTLPESIGNLSSLNELDLSNNMSITLPKSMENLSSLQKLNLVRTKLRILPGFLGNLKSLNVLDLRFNWLKSLPESIGNLNSLKKLYINNNQLSTLPDSLGNLSSLEKLWLSNNQLTILPETIGNLSSLKELLLSNNTLRTLPKSIGNLTSLESLPLSKNQLIDLPESITTLPSLKAIYISHNPLIINPNSRIKSILKQLEKKGVY